MGYYDDNFDFYTENSTPDRMGKGSSVTYFLNDNEVNITSGLTRITESIVDILSTPYGTRFFCPQYGSKIYLLLLEQNDFVAKDSAEEYARQALTDWEPRINVENIEAEIDVDKLYIHIAYTVKDTGTPGSYVYTIERKVPDLT